MDTFRMKNILHAFTGSIAATLSDVFIREYSKGEFCLEFIASNSALKFLDNIYGDHLTDEDEWSTYENDQRVLHIDLGDWADTLVIAPCTANTLAKIANGICDNLVTSIARSWDLKNKKMIVAPAMNTRMWEHPITQSHLEMLKSWGVCIIEPTSKTLYCGTTGIGAMADVSNIISAITE